MVDWAGLTRSEKNEEGSAIAISTPNSSSNLLQPHLLQHGLGTHQPHRTGETCETTILDIFITVMT